MQPTWSITINDFVYREHLPLKKAIKVVERLQDSVLGLAMERETTARELR